MMPLFDPEEDEEFEERCPYCAGLVSHGDVDFCYSCDLIIEGQTVMINVKDL